MRDMRTWKTRQEPKMRVKVKVRSEARSSMQGGLTHMDHWNCSVGKSLRLLNMEGQCGSLEIARVT